MKHKPHDIELSRYLEWTIGTPEQKPFRTVEWRFVPSGATKVGLGDGKYILFVSRPDVDTIAEYKAYLAEQSKPKRKAKTATKSDGTDVSNQESE